MTIQNNTFTTHPTAKAVGHVVLLPVVLLNLLLLNILWGNKRTQFK
jgi:hypothetical protein